MIDDGPFEENAILERINVLERKIDGYIADFDVMLEDIRRLQKINESNVERIERLEERI